MSSVIQFLESMGRDAVVARMAVNDMNELIDGLETADSLKHSLRSRDVKGLAREMRGDIKMWCFVVAPENEEDPAQGDGKDGERAPDDSDPPPASP